MENEQRLEELLDLLCNLRDLYKEGKLDKQSYREQKSPLEEELSELKEYLQENDLPY